jgi:hypothetical protein
MTLTFLLPAALFCGLLLALPIIVHLFKPRRIRVTPFSSLRWLELSPQKLARRIQWHQILLFLLRFGALALLVLALARPLLAPANQVAPVDRYIIVDVSRSMSYQPKDQPTRLARAVQLAMSMIQSAPPGDRTALLTTGLQTQLLSPLSGSSDHLPALLEKLQPGLTDTDLSSALSVIRPQLARTPAGTEVELCFFTDNYQQNWRQASIARFVKDLPVTVRVRIINVGVSAAQNGWIGRARLLQLANPDRRILRVEVGCVGDTNQERTLKLSGLRGVPEQQQKLTLNPGQPTVSDFLLPADFKLAGQVARFQLEPADALPSDDEYVLNLDTQAGLRVLLIEAPSTLVEREQPGLALRTALEAQAEVGGESLTLTRRSSTAVLPKDFADTDVVVLADVPELPEASLDALEKQVKAGTGLVVFLGPAGKPTFVTQSLYHPLDPTQGLLPALVVGRPGQPASKRDPLAPLTGVRWTHPLLTDFADPVYGDLAQTRFRTWHRFEAVPPPPADVLAWIDEETPALIDWPLGAGKVVIFNTSVNDSWTDLPKRKSYLPLLVRVLSYVGRGGVRRTFTVGEVVTLPLYHWQEKQKVRVKAPSGVELTPEVRGQGNGRGLLRLDATPEAGLYRVELEGDPASAFAFVVELGRGDSVLLPMEPATLKQWWEPAKVEIVSGDEIEKQWGASSRLRLWPALLVLASLLLLGEMFLVHWLCPRASPRLAQNLVQRQQSNPTRQRG